MNRRLSTWHLLALALAIQAVAMAVPSVAETQQSTFQVPQKVERGSSIANQIHAQLQTQMETVESAIAALMAAIEALAEAQAQKPDRNAFEYSTEDDDGEIVFEQARFDADVIQWQKKITDLTYDIIQKQDILASEQSKLASLQSEMGDAVSAGYRRRVAKLVKERKMVEEASEAIRDRFNDDVSGASPRAEIRKLKVRKSSIAMAAPSVAETQQSTFQVLQKVEHGSSIANQIHAQLQTQMETVESATAALMAAIEALAEAQAQKPDHNASKYSTKDDDGEIVFEQARFDADVIQWRKKITDLTYDIIQKQDILASEQSKLASLQGNTSQ